MLESLCFARNKYLYFHILILTRSVLKSSLYLGTGHNREKHMKKINVGHEVITEKNSWVGTLREVNYLLKKVNLKIQFQNSKYYTDDMIHRDQKDIPKKVVSEMATEIVLHEIEDDFDYIIKSGDVKKLKELIIKNQEDKKKIEDTIKLLKANS